MKIVVLLMFLASIAFSMGFHLPPPELASPACEVQAANLWRCANQRPRSYVCTKPIGVQKCSPVLPSCDRFVDSYLSCEREEIQQVLKEIRAGWEYITEMELPPTLME